MVALDLRSLALFRILLGLFTAGDALHRLIDLRAFYQDSGALPRSAITGEFANHWELSLFLMSDALWWQVFLFALCALAGLAMAAGYRTWIATFAGWLIVISVQNRSEVILDGGDMVQRLLLFWALFLPLGAIWSVESLRRETPRRPWVLTAGSAALTIQMISIFFFAALLKTGDPWRVNFNAVWYVMQWDVYITPVGVWMRQFPDVLRVLTVGTLIVEGLVPLLLLVPWAPVRVFAIGTLVSFHLGFLVAMKLFMFVSIMIAGWLSLTPGWLWDKLGVPLEMGETWKRRLARWPSVEEWSPLSRWPWACNRIAALCLLYVLCWNIRSVYKPFERVFPHSLNFPGFTLRIDQYWIMFAPSPVSEDGWFVVPGQLADGRIVDVFRDGAPVSWDRPESVANSYINRRWRRYLWTVTRSDSAAYRKYFAGYLCREWDRRHAEVLESLDIILMYENSLPDLTVSPPQKMVLWQGQKCH